MDFQVNYGALDGAAADIKSGASNLQGCLDDLENTLNQLRFLVGRPGSGSLQRRSGQVEPGPRGPEGRPVPHLRGRGLRSFQLPADGPGFRRPLLIAPRTRAEGGSAPLSGRALPRLSAQPRRVTTHPSRGQLPRASTAFFEINRMIQNRLPRCPHLPTKRPTTDIVASLSFAIVLAAVGRHV